MEKEKKDDSTVEELNEKTASLVEATKKYEEAKLAAQQAQADAKLAGKSEAGVEVKPKEETPAEYTARIMAGG